MIQRLLISGFSLGAIATIAFAAHATLASSTEDKTFEDLEISLQVSGPEEELAVLIAMEVLEEFTGVDVMDPDGNMVLELRSGFYNGLGECVLETRSGLDQGFGDYPAGPYRVAAYARDGTVYQGIANLSHELPSRPQIVAPLSGTYPAYQGLQLQWNALEAERVRVEVDGALRSMDVWLPGSETTFPLPASMMTPGAEYKLTVTALAANGNRIEVEHLFWVDR
ncbi:MAG: hypothetical protein O2816_17895 [Planctomycetota bacterium]|nr:hypothetical protein [Planctomycetota bacterium]